ncbi:MAG: type I restriction endonuclease subunit M [Betaproteobacteria bacterium]|nr:MAG: type I restriction endonuclease subunit M [Betaproteobacteria bacterium]
MTIITTCAMFPLGQVVATPDALALLQATKSSAVLLLNRHMHGDFGDVCKSDLAENEVALKHGLRVMSVYRLVERAVFKATPPADRSKLDTVWIITEADRSVTTILCPHNY